MDTRAGEQTEPSVTSLTVSASENSHTELNTPEHRRAHENPSVKHRITQEDLAVEPSRRSQQ